MKHLPYLFTFSDFKARLPYWLLFAISFYPVLPEAIASSFVVILVLFSFFFNGKVAKINYNKLGLKPIIINSGFYLLLIFSCLYSEDLLPALKTLKGSLILLFFPLALIYFLPRRKGGIPIYVFYGFIISNFILFVYFFNILVEGIAIDRMPGLLEANILEKIKALNTYPYEFVLSKARKHLTVLFEPHKVYLSIHFLIALILCYYAFLKERKSFIQKGILALLAMIFIVAIIYTQAVNTMATMLFLLLAFPFFLVKGSRNRLLFIGSFVLLGIALWNSGMAKLYSNKNSISIVNMIRQLSGDETIKEGVDKRLYIFDCAVEVIKKNPIAGVGAGDVQTSLNSCFTEKEYVVAEFLSVNSEINTHNYYLYLWAAGGVACILLFLALVILNALLAIRTKNYTYLMILFAIVLGLLTENLLVRMQGAFLFAIFNTIFYLNSILAFESK